jgi:hypothetical protein
MAATQHIQQLRPDITKYVPTLKSVEVEPVEIRKGRMQKVASPIQKKEYSLHFMRDAQNNYRVFAEIKDEKLSKLHARKKISEEWVTKEFNKEFDSRGGELLKIISTIEKAPPRKKKVLEKGLLEKVQEISKYAWGKVEDEISKVGKVDKSYVYRSKKLAMKIKKDIYDTLDKPYRADIRAGEKPAIILSHESEMDRSVFNWVDRLEAGDLASLEGKPQGKLLSKKKIGKGKYVLYFLGTLGIAAFIGYQIYKKARMAVGAGVRIAGEIEHLQAQLADYQTQIEGEKDELGEKLGYLSRVSAEQEESLRSESDSLRHEGLTVLDSNGDGIEEYVDANGDGIVDNDANKNGVPDINLETGEITDQYYIDHPEEMNQEAAAAFAYKILGIHDNAEINEANGVWDVAASKLQESEILSGVANSIGIDIDGDGNADYKIVKDLDGKWVPAEGADFNIDNDDKVDLIIKQDEYGNPVFEINDEDAPFDQYASETEQNLSDVKTQIQDEISNLRGSSSILDQNGNGVDDYVSRSGGPVDNDVNENGEDDINLGTGEITDSYYVEHPEEMNQEASAAFAYKTLGIHDNAEINEANGVWDVAANEQDMADNLQDDLDNTLSPAISTVNSYVQDINGVGGHLENIGNLRTQIDSAMDQIAAGETARSGYVGQAAGYISGLLGLGAAKFAADKVLYASKSLGGKPTLPGVLEYIGKGMMPQKVLAIDGVK